MRPVGAAVMSGCQIFLVVAVAVTANDMDNPFTTRMVDLDCELISDEMNSRLLELLKYSTRPLPTLRANGNGTMGTVASGTIAQMVSRASCARENRERSLSALV